MALLIGWQFLQKKRPELPNLKIYPCTGILSDEEFVKVFEESDSLLSEVQESIHDHFYHVTAFITLILCNPQKYREQKQEVIKAISEIKERFNAMDYKKFMESPYCLTLEEFRVMKKMFSFLIPASIDLYSGTYEESFLSIEGKTMI